MSDLRSPTSFLTGRGLFISLICLLASSGCNQCSPITVPTTFMMIGTPPVFGRQGAPASEAMNVFTSPDGVNWTKVASPDGPCPSPGGNPTVALCARTDVDSRAG